MRSIVLAVLLAGCCDPPQYKTYKITVVSQSGQEVFSSVVQSIREPTIGGTEKGVLRARVHSLDPDVYAPAGCLIRVEPLAEQEAPK